ncbi:hypothetical protein [Winogradskyella haliclonae]|nr:hypothetical protein [Winogradskyella haliclonae]
MTWVTLISFDLPYDENVLYFAFFATITAYNFIKYFGLAKFHHRSLANWLRIIQLFSAVAFVFMCYYLLQLNLRTLTLIGFLAVATFLYAIPLIPKRYLFDEQQNLREISGAKIYIIALVWAFVTVLLPIINAELELSADVSVTLFQRFCYVLVLMLPFEIRDLNYDSLKLATIPQKIGIKKTKIIGVLLLMVFIMLEFFKDEINEISVISTLMIMFITLLFLIFSSKKQHKYYSAFWVEALPIFWLGTLLLLR